MKKGDIIAWGVNEKTTSWISKAVAFVSRYTVGNWITSPTQKSYSHVAIVSEKEGYYYEAWWPKSRHKKFDSKDYEKYNVLYLEHKNITDEKREKIIEYCQKNMGKWYDIISILTFGLVNFKKNPVCSDFVSNAYRDAGIELEKSNEKLFSPNEIVYNKKMGIADKEWNK